MMPSFCKPKFVVSQVTTGPEAHEACGFKVKWQINPHMKIGSVDTGKAMHQHNKFIKALRHHGAEALSVPYVCRAHDSVFMKDNAVIATSARGPRALLARPANPERAIEPLARAEHLESLGIEVIGQSTEFLEGGDVVISPRGDQAFLGYGFRSSRKAVTELENFLGIPVTPLKLADPYFYHLDTCLNFVSFKSLCVGLAYKDAFTPRSWRILNSHDQVDRVLEVSRAEAMNLALNWVEIDGTVIMGAEAPRTRRLLESMGKKVVVSELEQFRFAGGSAACLVAQIYQLN